ncbi:MAG: imidazolonepropionase [Alphaproteobacteria bacterium]|nr:imidazolonepropionase [Alphaproteobacteria bacterium]
MFDNLWINIHAATMSEAEGFGIIKNAAIGIQDGKIAWIGAASDLPQKPEALSDYIYDGQGKWMTPGLIDCHTHLVYAGDRAGEFEQRLHGVSYAEIAKAGGGILATVKATRAATEQELYDAALARIRVLFHEGVTTFEMKSGYGLDTATEGKILRAATSIRDDLGLRIQRSFLGAHALPPEYAGRADDYIDFICHDMLPALHAEKLVDCVDGFCENIGFTRAQIEKVFKKSQELGLPVKLHAEQLSNQHGAALAAQYKALSADHIEYLDENGVKAMAAAGTAAVLLPGAFYFLREKQLPPIDLLRKYKVPMAIATDHNPGTSPTLSILLMLNMACTLFRLTPEEALAGATANAARALGYRDTCGTLEKGKAADLALWDITHPRDLCYYFGRNPCKGVVMAGSFNNFEMDQPR